MIALGIPGEKIRVHHTGVDQAKFRPRERLAAKAALGVEGPLAVSVGYLIPRKGQSFLIEAMAALPGVTLLIAGDGPDRKMLAGRISALGLGERVRLIGAQPHDALPALLAAADAMALPSSSEGLANVWVEALACGTPIVITDVGGARELVDRPAAGRLVARTAEAIAEGIRAVLADPRPADEVAEAARRFTWEANRDALYEHLKGLVGR
jgi:glycosyltransferase involved in cell wall biosynthesis